MTPLIQQAGAVTGSPALAGTDAIVNDHLVATAAVLGIMALIYVAMFISALVRSARHLHQAGRTQHPHLLVFIPVGALFLACVTKVGYIEPMLPWFTLAVAGLGLGFGYVVMFVAGRDWFRWTAFLVPPAYYYIWLLLFLAAGDW